MGFGVCAALGGGAVLQAEVFVPIAKLVMWAGILIFVISAARLLARRGTAPNDDVLLTLRDAEAVVETAAAMGGREVLASFIASRGPLTCARVSELEAELASERERKSRRRSAAR